jgi:hypothetical protein
MSFMGGGDSTYNTMEYIYDYAISMDRPVSTEQRCHYTRN